MSDYTPTKDRIVSWLMEGASTGQGADYREEAFDTWLAEHDAKVRAEVIRGAAQALRMGLRGSACNEGCHKADRITLEMWADRIEKEAGL